MLVFGLIGWFVVVCSLLFGCLVNRLLLLALDCRLIAVMSV